MILGEDTRRIEPSEKLNGYDFAEFKVK